MLSCCEDVQLYAAWYTRHVEHVCQGVLMHALWLFAAGPFQNDGPRPVCCVECGSHRVVCCAALMCLSKCAGVAVACVCVTVQVCRCWLPRHVIPGVACYSVCEEGTRNVHRAPITTVEGWAASSLGSALILGAPCYPSSIQQAQPFMSAAIVVM